MTRPALRVLALTVMLTSVAGASVPLTAQTGGSAVRIGVSFGGISTVGMSVEYVDDHRSLDLTFGTWSFRDLGVSVAVKQYFGAGDLLPFVGAGVWLVGARPSGGPRTGFAAVLHAPIGIDWQGADDHYLGLTLNVNRALWVRRTDPEDDLPLNHRLVPLPGVYYRWRS